MSFVSYKDFCKMYNLNRVIGFNEDEMDISMARGGIMNCNGDVFKIGDKILVDGMKVKVIGFAAYDYDWFGAICVGRNKGIAKWFRVDDAVNLTLRETYKGTIIEVLIDRGFRSVDGSFVLKNMTIEIHDDVFDVYLDYMDGEYIDMLYKGIPQEQANDFFDKCMDMTRMYIDSKEFKSKKFVDNMPFSQWLAI